MREPLLPQAKALREDKTEKGKGFLGQLPVPDGSASEMSISTDQFGGKDFPSIVPTLNASELNQVLSKRIPDSAIQKAEEFARQRIAAGKPMFAEEGEQNYDVLPTFMRIK